MNFLFKSIGIAAVIGSITGTAYADCSDVLLNVRISPTQMYKVTKVEYWGKGGKWRTARSRGFFNSRGFTVTVGKLKSPSNTSNRFRVTAKAMLGSKITFGVAHNIYARKQQFESNNAFCTDGMRYDLTI